MGREEEHRAMLVSPRKEEFPAKLRFLLKAQNGMSAELQLDVK